MEIALKLDDFEFVVDKSTGSLHISTEDSSVTIPHETANELVSMIHNKLAEYHERNKKWFWQ